MTTMDMNKLTAETVASRRVLYPECNVLAGRLCVSSLHSDTIKHFSMVIAEHRNIPLLAHDNSTFVINNANALDSAIHHARDYNFNFDDFEALSKHLFRVKGKIVERPQHLFMRMAISMRGKNTDSVIETYDTLSRRLSKTQTAGHFQTGNWQTD